MSFNSVHMVAFADVISLLNTSTLVFPAGRLPQVLSVTSRRDETLRKHHVCFELVASQRIAVTWDWSVSDCGDDEQHVIRERDHIRHVDLAEAITVNTVVAAYHAFMGAITKYELARSNSGELDSQECQRVAKTSARQIII